MYALSVRTVGLSVLVMVAHIQFLFAQEAVEHESIVEITVTADPLSEVDTDIIRPVQVLSKEELKSRSIRNIGETVANELGVSSSDFGTGVGRPVIRGLGGSRVQVLENGLSTMDAASISADHSVPTEAVFAQQVEIFRGPATLLFGSGASGGIVNYVNGRILDYVPDDVEAEVSLQYETVSDGMTGAGRLNFGAGDFAFHIDGMTRDTDDYNIPGFADMEPGESRRGILENSSINTDSISGGLSWIGRRGYVGFSVSRYENNYGIQGHHHHGDEHDHGHGMDDMHLHDEDEHDHDEDEHDHDEDEEHHDDDHDHDEENGHHDDDDDHDHDEDEEHHDEDDDHDHDEENGHHDEDDDHDHDEENGHHDDDDDHDHDEENGHHDEDDDHDHDEENGHHDEDDDHDHDEENGHHDEDDDHDHDEENGHHDDDDDHDHDEENGHHDDDDDHDHDEENGHHDDDDDHDHDEENGHHDDDDDHDHDEENGHHDEDDDHDHDEGNGHHDDDDDHDHDEENGHHDEDDDHDHDEENGHHDEDDDHDHDEEGDEHDHDEEGDEHDHDEEEEGGVRIDLEQTRYDFVAALDNPLPGLSRVKMRWGFNDYQHDEIEPNGEVGTAFDNEEVEGRVEFVHNPIGNWNGVVGVHYRHKDFAAVGAESFVLPSELESVGFFILERTDIGRWHIDLGARFEHQDSNAETGAKNDYDLFSASGGLNWNYAPGYQVGLSVSHSERAPSIEELYAQGPHLATATFEIGDANLDKEKSNNIDIYWRKTAGKFTASANFFYNRIDDYIYKQEQDLNGDGFADRVAENFDGNPANILHPDDDEEPLLVYLSQDDAEFLGFEAETRARLMDDDNGRMTLRLWADYVEGERSNDINLARITPWRFGSGLTYSRGDFYATANYTRVNEQDSTAPLETETDGYHLLDIHADYTLRMGGNTVTLFARASNLLDEEIRRHISFVKDRAPLPGRSGIFGVRMSF